MPLPDDLAALYSLANGMIDYAHDKHLVSFWSIQRMVADRDDNGPDEIGFADFLLSSWYFVYKPCPPATVMVRWQSVPDESLPTVSAFLEAYVSTPERFCVL